jgi:hypothetical protein
VLVGVNVGVGDAVGVGDGNTGTIGSNPTFLLTLKIYFAILILN